MNYDNLYIDQLAQRGMWLDLEILFKTVARVFTKSSIYEERPEGLSDELAAEESEAMIIELAHRMEEGDEKKESNYVS